jgi:hypothetical protein
MERRFDVGDFQMAPPGFGLTVSADRGRKSNLAQGKIGIGCFTAKYAKFRKGLYPSAVKLFLTPDRNRFNETVDMETV